MNKLGLLLFAVCVGVFNVAQSQFEKKTTLDVWFGVRHFNQPPMSDATVLNFFDYYFSDSESTQSYRSTYEYLGFGWNKRWNRHWESDLRITVNSALEPNTLFLRGTYFPQGKVGFMLTYQSVPQLMNSFTPYFEPYQTNYIITINDPDWWQWNMYDYAFLAGIIYPVTLGPLELRPAFNAGVVVGSFFKTSVNFKERETNFRQRIDYEFLFSPFVVINPQIQIHLKCFQISNFEIGMQMKAEWLYGQRSIPYRQTKHEWVMQHPVRETVRPPRHHFNRLEFDAGLYTRW